MVASAKSLLGVWDTQMVFEERQLSEFVVFCCVVLLFFSFLFFFFSFCFVFFSFRFLLFCMFSQFAIGFRGHAWVFSGQSIISWPVLVNSSMERNSFPTCFLCQVNLKDQNPALPRKLQRKVPFRIDSS